MLAATGRLGEFDISSLSSLEDEAIPPIRRSSATRLSASRIQTTSYAPDSALDSPGYAPDGALDSSQLRPRRAMSTTNVQVNSFPSTVINEDMEGMQSGPRISNSNSQTDIFRPVGQNISEISINELNGFQYSDLSLTPSTSSSEYSQNENQFPRQIEQSQIEPRTPYPFIHTGPPQLPLRQEIIQGSHPSARQTMSVGPQINQAPQEPYGPHGPVGPHGVVGPHGTIGPHDPAGPPLRNESVTERLARIREDLIR